MLTVSILSLLLIIRQSAADSADVAVINGGTENLIIHFGTSGEALLGPGESIVFLVDGDYSSEFWARAATCLDDTNCTSARTWARISLQVPGDSGVTDFYGVSVAEGYNRGASVDPKKPICKVSECKIDLEKDCPEELQLTDNGVVIACSANSLLYQPLCPDAVYTAEDPLLSCSSPSYAITFL